MKGQDLKENQKVHYIESKKTDPSDWQNGIVKSIQDEDYAFVVYHCNGEWDNIENYTAQRTNISQLERGWVLDVTENLWKP